MTTRMLRTRNIPSCLEAYQCCCIMAQVFIDAPHPASGLVPRDVAPFFSPPYYEWFTAESMVGCSAAACLQLTRPNLCLELESALCTDTSAARAPEATTGHSDGVQHHDLQLLRQRLAAWCAVLEDVVAAAHLFQL